MIDWSIKGIVTERVSDRNFRFVLFVFNSGVLRLSITFDRWNSFDRFPFR